MESILARVMATVLGLIALGGVIYAMSNANDLSKANQMVNDLSQIVSQTRQQYANSTTGYRSFQAWNANALYSAGIIPPDLMKNGTPTDPWGFSVFFFSVANDSQFQIQFGGQFSNNQMPLDSCVQVATSLSGFVSMQIGSQVFTSTPDAVSASNACQAKPMFYVTYS